ncbi:hypothetical protein DERF_007449 [Dermatophagoides farinae]|uniref:Uncharacterized protein n=1 Tax=Dermatophagoides farinae TaxID=6954 RepID=A0A922I0D3_DERFA|nr:hypothetical protein DERF_007449 [Dermatophagoides farinae]
MTMILYCNKQSASAAHSIVCSLKQFCDQEELCLLGWWYKLSQTILESKTTKQRNSTVISSVDLFALDINNIQKTNITNLFID